MGNKYLAFHGSPEKFYYPSINNFDIKSLNNDTNEFGVYFLYISRNTYTVEVEKLVANRAKEYALRDSSKGYLYIYHLNSTLFNGKLLYSEVKMSFEDFKELFKGYKISESTIRDYYDHPTSTNNANLIRLVIGFYKKVNPNMNWEDIAHELTARTGKNGFIHGNINMGTIVLWNPEFYHSTGELEYIHRKAVKRI